MTRIREAVARFAEANKGIAAVECALIFPLALIMYIGTAQVSDAVMTSRKTSLVTRTLVDLLSLQSTSAQATSTPTPTNAVPASTLNDLLVSATSMLQPQPSTTLKMTISAIDVTNTALGICCNATVRWTYTQDGTLRPCGVQLTASTATTPPLNQMPTELLPVGTALPRPLSYIVADVSYTYQPIFRSSYLPITPTFQRTEYMMPRAIGQVVTGSLPASGAQNGQVCY